MPRFSSILMDHFQEPRNQGLLEHPDRVGIAGTPGAGAFLVLHLQIAGDRVVDARFQSHGCGVTIACGSVLTDLVIGTAYSELAHIDTPQLREALGGVPGDKEHCLRLAIAALRNAVENQP